MTPPAPAPKPYEPPSTRVVGTVAKLTEGPFGGNSDALKSAGVDGGFS